MSETLVDALVRILRRQVAAGTRTAPLAEGTLAALLAASSRPRPGPSSAPPPQPRTTHERRAPQPAPQAVPAVPLPTANPVTPPLPDPNTLGWDELQALVRECRRCPLCAARTQTVFGDGSRTAPLLFVGEGPGREEDLEGLPFVGAAGQLLTRMISAMQFARAEVYIANIVKCRPPYNRPPEPAEAQACLPYLKRQIELLRPKVIVTLGATPLQFLLGRSGITRERGVWSEYNSIPAMPTYHPAYLLRAPEHKREVWEDLKQVMARLGRAPAATPRRPEGNA
jgi:DNA polymerase